MNELQGKEGTNQFRCFRCKKIFTIFQVYWYGLYPNDRCICHGCKIEVMDAEVVRLIEKESK